VTETIENKALIQLIAACTIGTNLATMLEDLEEFETCCYPELIELSKETRTQIKKFLNALSNYGAAQYKEYAEKLK